MKANAKAGQNRMDKPRKVCSYCFEPTNRQRYLFGGRDGAFICNVCVVILASTIRATKATRRLHGKERR